MAPRNQSLNFWRVCSGDLHLLQEGWFVPLIVARKTIATDRYHATEEDFHSGFCNPLMAA